ncbi:MAG: ADP-dependent glucokinase/phosphofructokinase, partial [Candidatus Bathyarchaeia archaeon]
MTKVKVATGLYVNWDSFIKVNDEVLNWMENFKALKPSSQILNKIEEAVYTLKEALKEGGKEYLISKNLYDALNIKFKNRVKRLGGNSYHMGKALYILNILPLVSYPCRPRNIMLASPDFMVACEGKLKTPKEAIREGDPEFEHIVFEFHEDAKKGIHTFGRQIFSWDEMSSKGLFDYEFLNYLPKCSSIEVLILGFAHLLLPEHKKKIDEVVELLSYEYKPKIHLELGEGSKESVKYAIKKFTDNNLCNSIGMNEKECKVYLEAESTKIKDLIEAAFNAIENYDLERVCVHSNFFAFSISKLDWKIEFEALKEACLISAAFTFKTFNVKKAELLPFSDVKTLKTKINSYNLTLIPTLINSKAEVLTGLGDTFAA